LLIRSVLFRVGFILTDGITSRKFTETGLDELVLSKPSFVKNHSYALGFSKIHLESLSRMSTYISVYIILFCVVPLPFCFVKGVSVGISEP
jgi:hypothetical protein